MSSPNLNEPTFLRIKRKRNDDPIHALVVSCDSKKKKLEKDELGTGKDHANIGFDFSKKKKLEKDELGTVAESLFQFAATFNEGDDTKDIIDQIQKGRLPLKNYNVNIKKIKRNTQKDSQKLARFTIVSKKRELTSDSKGFKVVDALPDFQEDNAASNADSTYENNDRLLCNSEEMIREKLHISDPTPKVDTAEKDFVYDLYFIPSGILNAESEILKVEEFYEDICLEHDIASDEEIFDDEDDENAEDNWRNDYPDEDYYDNMSSHDDKDSYGDVTSDDDDDDDDDDIYSNNRYRSGKGRLEFDPYARGDDEYYKEVYSEDET